MPVFGKKLAFLPMAIQNREPKIEKMHAANSEWKGIK